MIHLTIPQVNTVGLVAHYKLQYGLMTAGKVFDYTLRGNIGILNGSSALPAYPGINLDGTEDRIEVADSTSFDGTAQLTACAWAESSSAAVAGNMAIFSKYGGSNNKREWLLRLNSAEKIKVIISEDGTLTAGKFWTWDSDDAIPNVDRFHHYGFTFNAGDFALYIDGVSVDVTDSQSNTGTVINNDDAPFLIGATFSNSTTPAYTEHFSGKIGETFLFDRTLSPAEVRSIYEITRATYGV